MSQAWCLPSGKNLTGSIGQLTIEPLPADADRGVTVDALRSISPAEIIAQARLALADHSEFLDLGVALGWKMPTADEITAIRDAAKRAEDSANRKRGRPSKGDDFFKGIALEYLGLLNTGWGRGILIELARRHGVPRETARDWVHKARKLQFLPPGTPGRAGGGPGPRLLSGHLLRRC